MIAWLVAGIFAAAIGAWHMLPSTIDPELRPYLEEFVEDANKYGHKITIDDVNYVGFVPLPGRIAGLGIPPNILIDPESKYHIELRELVYHEAAHSIFNCLHTDKPSIMGTELYITHENNWDFYVESLFTTEFEENSCTDLR